MNDQMSRKAGSASGGESNVKILQEISEELLKLMGVSASVEVSYNKEAEVFEVNINSIDATGLLIGKKGETLGSIENILGVMLKGKVGEWYRVSVNIGDYKEKEEEYLKNLAKSAAERVLTTEKPENIYNLKGWQRRVIHMYLAENYPNLTSDSTGEGEERCLVISPKNS